MLKSSMLKFLNVESPIEKGTDSMITLFQEKEDCRPEDAE